MWYVMQVPPRHELETADTCRKRVLTSEEDIFPMMREYPYRNKDRDWEKKLRVAFPHYIFVDTEDAEGFAERLKSARVSGWMLGSDDILVPVYPEERELLLRIGGENHIIPCSIGFKKGDRLVVTDGPLKYLEGNVKWTDRHQRLAGVEIELLGRPVIIKLGVEILKKID